MEAKLGLRTQVPEDQLRGPGSLEGVGHLGDQETHSKRTSQGYLALDRAVQGAVLFGEVLGT